MPAQLNDHRPFAVGAARLNTQALRDTIALACRHEHLTRQLEQRLEQQLPALHPIILLPAANAVQALSGFASRYIELVPETLENAAQRANDAGTLEEVYPLLQLAVDYFVKPPELKSGRVCLEELLDDAYLAQRLIEEAGDYHLHLTGSALAIMDTLRANLIIHHLIGEPLASQLDHAVQLACRTLYRSTAQAPAQPGGAQLLQRPCLAAQFHLDLCLPGAATINDRAV